MNLMRGPANLGSNDDWGCLIKGFSGPPPVMMPHNPPYYAEQFEKWGMAKVKDLYSHMVGSILPFPDRVERVAEYAKKKNKITIRRLDMKHFDRDIDAIKNIYNKGWADHWGFVPMTDNEFRYLAMKLKPVVWKDFVHFVEMDGKIIAMNVMIPNLNQVLIHMNGELDLVGIAKFLWYKREINTVREIIMGILPEYRNKGIAAMLHIEAMRTAQKHKIWFGDMSWTLEDNHLVNNDIRSMGGVLYKVYRLFDKKIV
jgi:GNAT superfamily N-acetyltransferase